MKRVTLFIFAVLTQITTVMAQFEVAKLPYAYDALAPSISEETLKFHHDKHYTGYVNKLNELTGGTPFATMTLEETMLNSDGAMFNNAAQAWNHEFYFAQLSDQPQSAPTGKLLDAINATFGGVDALKEKMSAEAIGLFGSGWAWLVADDNGVLSIVAEPNAGNPLTKGLKPIMTIDVWEHAYYIDYRNARAEAVKNIWNVIDWKTVEARY